MWIVSREAEKEPTGMKKKSKEAQRKISCPVAKV
jgi:hypothetical protein